MLNFWATFKKNKQINKRAYPISHIMGFMLNGITFILFPIFIYYYLFQGNVSDSFIEATHNSDYITYITKGVSISMLSVATLFNCSRAFITEIWEGTFDPFLMSPSPRIPYYFGVFVEQLSRASIGFLTSLVLGIAFGARFPLYNLHYYIFILLLVLIASFSMAVSISTLMVYTRNTFITQNTIFNTMFLICGMLFPISYLPISLQYLSQIFPLTPALALMRSIPMLDLSNSGHMNLIVQLLVLSVLYFSIGHYLFIKLEKKLIENVLS